MTKLHELLAAEKTPMAAWNQVYEETLKKFSGESHYFSGHSKTLHMIEEGPGNEAIEAQAREEKPVTTTVRDTLEYALDLYGRAEDLQFQKNATNRSATGTVLFRGEQIFAELPVDELLGLESRLAKIRILIAAVPTLDASKHWGKSVTANPNVWVTLHLEETTKTEKQVIPVVLSAATKEHPAQVQPIQKDVVVGRFTTVKRSGAATALQKAEAIKRIDELIVEIKQARMRANEAQVSHEKISHKLVSLLMEPFESSIEDHP
jgi:hypothetical protein